MSETDKSIVKKSEEPVSIWRSFDRVFDDFRREFDDLFIRPSWRLMPRIRMPALDIKDEDEKFMIQAEIPGLDKADIKIELNKNALEIKGEKTTENEEEKEGYIRKERGTRSFYRRLILPENIKGEEIETSLDKGVLTINIPKKEPEPKKEIKIE